METSEFENTKPALSYWLSPNGKVHIFLGKKNKISKNELDLFTLTRTEYVKLYKKYKNPYSDDEARDEIKNLGYKKGWICMQESVNDCWLCELWLFDENSKNKFVKWLKKFLFKDHDFLLRDYRLIEIHEISKMLAGKPESGWNSLFDCRELLRIIRKETDVNPLF